MLNKTLIRKSISNLSGLLVLFNKANDKYIEEKVFWRGEIEKYLSWYRGKIEFHYGTPPPDFDGELKAIAELNRVLAVGGNLLFVVPIEQPKIMFNAHRIYSYDQVLEYFKRTETGRICLGSKSAE